MKQLWLKLTLLAGTLDLGYAALLTAAKGADVGKMLRGVAAGPLGDAAATWGPAGSLAGVGVHFVLMGVMVAVFLALARHTPVGRLNPWWVGPLYGLGLWLVMYGLVLPARFGAPFPPPDPARLLLGLFPHVFLVGLPIALGTRRWQNQAQEPARDRARTAQPTTR